MMITRILGTTMETFPPQRSRSPYVKSVDAQRVSPPVFPSAFEAHLGIALKNAA
jgi:hypothetical protein